MRKIFKVGESVLYRPNFGAGAPTVEMIKGLEITKRPGMKSGDSVNEVTLEQLSQNNVVVTLGNGWAYGNQIINVDRVG